MRKTREQLYDELLVLRSLEGDRQALGELVTRWHPRLRRHAYCLIGNREAAEDVVQETWLAIVKGLSRLDVAEAFAGWAYRIVANKCVDWVRQQDRQRRLSANLSGHASVERHEDRGSLDRADGLRSALERLPGDRRVLLCMHYVEGFGVKQIAGILGVPNGTVKSRLYHPTLLTLTPRVA